MEKTHLTSDLGQKVLGYVLNTGLSEENQKKVTEVQLQLSKELPGLIWPQPPATLHITLLDLLAPLVDYGQSKDQIFEDIFPHYDHTIENILREHKPVMVDFNNIKIAPKAIYALGTDDGTYQKIRSQFTANIELLPGTKPPPGIIHFTVARFLQEIDQSNVIEFLTTINFSLSQCVDNFRLVREFISPMLGYQILKTYRLA